MYCEISVRVNVGLINGRLYRKVPCAGLYLIIETQIKIYSGPRGNPNDNGEHHHPRSFREYDQIYPPNKRGHSWYREYRFRVSAIDEEQVWCNHRKYEFPEILFEQEWGDWERAM